MRVLIALPTGAVKNFAVPRPQRAVSRQYSVTSQRDFTAPPIIAPRVIKQAVVVEKNGFSGNRAHVSHSQLDSGSAMSGLSSTTRVTFAVPPLPQPSSPAPVSSNFGFVDAVHGYTFNEHVDNIESLAPGSTQAHKMLQRLDSTYGRSNAGVERMYVPQVEYKASTPSITSFTFSIYLTHFYFKHSLLLFAQ